MTFTETELMMMEDKPRFLNDEEKRLRINCKKKIQYEKNKKYYQQYHINNKEGISETKKKYKKTPQGYKITKKCNWNQIGLNMDNFEQIFKRYCKTTKCDNCNCILTIDRYNTATTKCMDHDHITGEFRNVLCNDCNVRRK